jgi:cytochrome c oxidase subunit 5b
MGPGGPGDRISTPYEHTVGVERLEYLAKMSGKNLWLMEPLKIDHYGTLEDPIHVESMVGERIAGCTGFPKWSHEVVWMKVTGTKRCPECGQAFKIKKVGTDS